MNAIKKNIPNAITCLNLLFGCMAIVFIFHNRLANASWMIIFAAIADFFDGMAARVLNVNSPIGKELDSLADVVSFGVAPGMMIFQLINNSHYSWIGLCVPIFSAIRLAKFNIDTRQTTYFIGVPTPAIGLLIASFPLIIEHDSYWQGIYNSNIVFTTWLLIFIAVSCSALMVAPIKLLSMKVKDMSWANNKVRYALVIFSLISIIALGFTAVPIIMALYIVLSLVAKESAAEHE